MSGPWLQGASPTPERGSRRWLARLAYAVVAIAILTVVAWLAVPPIVRWQIESRLSEALGRQTTIESVAFNPFALRLTIRNAIVANESGSALLEVDRVVADVSSASIWHRAPVFDGLEIVRPRVWLSRNREGRFNVQDLVDRALAPSSEPTPRFSLNNVEIREASVAFDDGVTGRSHALAALDVGIPFLSSLPYETEIHVTPRVAGTFNGSRFALAGTTAPFRERHETTLDIDVDALPMPAYVPYLPVAARVSLAGGSLTTRLKLAFVGGAVGERRLELRGDARVDGLVVDRRDGSRLAAARHVGVTIDRMDLIAGDTSIASIEIDAPDLDVRRLSDGTFEWAQPLFDSPSTTPQRPPSAPASERTSRVSIARVSVDGGTVSLADQTTGFRSTLVDVTLAASNVSTAPGQKGHVALSFITTDRIASFSGEADVDASTAAAAGRFAVSKFSLGLLFPYYESALAVDVQKGSLDYASAFSIDAAGDLRLGGGEATISDLRVALAGSRDPLWQVSRIAAASVDVDVRARNVAIGEARVGGASLRLVRDADGSLAMSRLVRPSATATTDEGWTVLARKLALERAAIDFEDRVPDPPVKLAVRELAVDATDVTNAAGARSGVTLRSRIGDRGRIRFAGHVARSPLRVSGDIDASGLALAAVKPYFEPQVNVVLTGGALAAKGRIAVDTSDAGRMRASWKGDASIADFAALDKPTMSDLARWKSLVLDGMDVATDPLRASVGRIGVDDFYARAIVYQDGTLNLARLLTPGQSPAPADEETAAPAVASTPARKALPISIGRIEFDRGNVNFSDFFIKPNYSVNLTDLKGTVSTMSEEQAGNLAVVARVDHTAPVEVQGHIHPFARELSLDISAKARDVDLPPLTPYSTKYAGYGIEKGKLTFEVHYRLDDRKLAADNHLILDQLTFGERVESPTATKLPVLLAVALLKDTRGVIDINLPIAGSLDDPKFSVGGLIVRVIVNLIAKAATAPFALLSAAFGGGEELSTLPFAAGSARIELDAQRRLDTLSKALAQRPGLKLEIGGRADPAADREALRRAAVELAIKRAKMKELVRDGNAPASVEEVVIAADERDRWLKAAYRDAALPDRPRNIIGLLKDVPPADMEAMLYASATADDDALRLLANSRAHSVKDAIAAKGVAAERLFLVAPRVGEDAGTKRAPGTSMRVDLSLG